MVWRVAAAVRPGSADWRCGCVAAGARRGPPGGAATESAVSGAGRRRRQWQEQGRWAQRRPGRRQREGRHGRQRQGWCHGCGRRAGCRQPRRREDGRSRRRLLLGRVGRASGWPRVLQRERRGRRPRLPSEAFPLRGRDATLGHFKPRLAASLAPQRIWPLLRPGLGRPPGEGAVEVGRRRAHR